MNIGDRIPVEPGFRDNLPVFWWRCEWDEECFCHVQAVDEAEAVEKAVSMMARGQPGSIPPPPQVVAKIKEWVVVAVPN